MRAVFGLVLILGMGLAGFAVYMVKGYMSDQQVALAQERARAAQTVATVDVYAAKRPVAFGDPLTPDDVAIIKYAKDHLPEGIYLTEAELFPEGTEVPRYVIRPMQPNEPVIAASVSAPGESPGIQTTVRPLMRAFTIQVDGTTGVSGFLRPGDNVDIYWTGSTSRAQGPVARESTHLIGSGIELIAVDQSTDRNRMVTAIPRTVTVQVAPADVASLAQAQRSGSLSLAILGQGTTVARVPDGEPAINLPEIREEPIAVAQAPAPQPMAEEICTTTLRRGTEMIESRIPCSN